MKNILVFSSSYSFLLYLAHNDVDYDNDVLVTDENMPEKISSRFKKSIVFRGYNNKNKIFNLLNLLSKFHDITWLMLNVLMLGDKVKIIGNDHLYYSRFMKLWHYDVVEDGTSNYMTTREKSFVNRFFIGKSFGEHKNCRRVYLTGLMEIPQGIKSKVRIWSLNKLSDQAKKRIITAFGEFNYSYRDGVSILLTQPLSEDGIITEQEKINLYSKVIDENKNENEWIIKKHPREKTIYKDYFDSVIEVDHQMPMEVFTIQNIMFTKAITLFSTAIYNVKSKEKIILGSLNNKDIEARFGIINRQEIL